MNALSTLEDPHEVGHETHQPAIDDGKERKRAANDNGCADESQFALLAPIVWRYENASLDLAQALGEIAADLWLAGQLCLDDGVKCGHNCPHHGAHNACQSRGGEATDLDD